MALDEIITPAARLIKQYGTKRLAHWAGRHPGRVASWAWPPARGGTGGVVPHQVRARIITGAAHDCGDVLTFADFEPGPNERYLTDAEPDVLGESAEVLRGARAQ